MISVILSRLVIILFGNLYPAYASYKAVKTKNFKEYVKWMMYWIVYAIFTCIEAFTDLFVSWLPFYYEVKIIIILWLMLPTFKGASVLYKKFIHPQLSKREEEIDNYISRASDQGYSTLMTIGSKGINYATNVILATAIKGQESLSEQLKKSYSLNDLSQEPKTPTPLDHMDGVLQAIENEEDGNVVEKEDAIREEEEEEEGEENKHEGSETQTMKLIKRKVKTNKTSLEAPKKRSRSKKNYNHDEVYHYGTMPRAAHKTRASLNNNQ